MLVYQRVTRGELAVPIVGLPRFHFFMASPLPAFRNPRKTRSAKKKDTQNHVYNIVKTCVYIYFICIYIYYVYIYMIIYFGNHLAVHSTANRRAAYTHEPNCLYQVGVNVPRHIHMCTHVLFYMCVYVYIYIHTCMIIYKYM